MPAARRRLSGRGWAIRKLLIANRGEIAIRIARAASELGLETVAVYTADDQRSLHVLAADEALLLEGEGAAGYLFVSGMIDAARRAGCDAVHPGYGFLSENADFARACSAAGLRFVGPDADALSAFGDKANAKRLARAAGVPVIDGIETGDAGDAAAFYRSLPEGAQAMVKAVSGGGGRGIRLVSSPDALESAIAACAAEAEAGFGSGAVLVERFIARARHIEVQIVADAHGGLIAIGERDCSVQRMNQKVVEIAPAPGLSDALRERLLEAAERIMRQHPYAGLATVEFLLDLDTNPGGDPAFAFMEINPRLQVEHTITEEVCGIDLVKASIEISTGKSLAALGLAARPQSRGAAIQFRINAERYSDGAVRPAMGLIAAYEQPGGPGMRVDGAGYVGYAANPRFDTLLAKLIVRGDDHRATLARGKRALEDFRIAGLDTNLELLARIADRPELISGDVDTRWFERTVGLDDAGVASVRHFAESAAPDKAVAAEEAPLGTSGVPAPLSGLIVSVAVEAGDSVRKGQDLVIIEALKMQHVVSAPASGRVVRVSARPGDIAVEGRAMVFVEPLEIEQEAADEGQDVDLDWRRPDLAETDARHALTLDEGRPDAVARRRKTGLRTARENLDDLFDAGSFVEYGALAIAAQRRRRSVDDLMRSTPADGLVCGFGTVNAAQFGDEAARCAGLAYDFTVLAGTQGHMNHRKTDRVLAVVEELRTPFVFYAEGGGGRPGDVDAVSATGLTVESFSHLARLSGLAPRIGITTGRCFAGNAVFLGCCDIVIATEGSNIGLGGPAMIEGGGLGVFTPEEIGPIDLQWSNGVVDVRVADEAGATDAARTLLSFFQGALPDTGHADQRLLRQAVPENRLRVYDVHTIIGLLADTGSFVELRGGFAKGMITGFMRLEGRPVGVIANDPKYLSGAIDSDGSDKAARFMQLCDAFGIPIVSLCDTPGFMVGPESEKTAAVRHGSRMFVVGASLSVPVLTVVLRKAYGLGAMAMAGGSLHASAMCVSWPTGEFGGMGLEGAVRLGYRKELEAIDDPEARERRYRELVEHMYATGKAVSVAQYIEIDAVIDPADTRKWLLRAIKSTPESRGTRRYIDCW